MLRKSLIMLTMISLLVFSSFAGGAQEEPEATTAAETTSEELGPESSLLHTPGKLTVATGEPVYPPWMMDDDPAGGEGFENGLVYALAEELGFDRDDVVWVRQTFDQGITPGKKPYDFNIQQYSITEERKEFVDFSDMYYKPEKAVVALPGSEIANAKTYADLKKLRWGATIGTIELDYIEKIIGVEDVAVYNDQAATFQALLSNQIDATVIGLPTALFVTAVQVPEATVAAILPHDPKDLGFGFVFEKDSPLVDWINEGLAEVLAKGVVEELTDKYLIGDDSIPEISQ